MIATATVNEQALDNTVRPASPPPSQASSAGFWRWGRWTSIAPSNAPSTASTAATSTTSTPGVGFTVTELALENSRLHDRCEDLKMKSDINQDMLNDCVTELKTKATEVEALQDRVRNLQAQLDNANQDVVKLHLEQVRCDHTLVSKDKQLAEQVAQSKMYADACNELTAKLTQQHEELTGAHAYDKQQLEAKDQEIGYLQGKLKEQEVAGNNFELATNEKITQLEDDLRCLNQDIEGRAAKHAAELQSEAEEHFGDLVTELRARIAGLEAENVKLYAQLMTDDDLDAVEEDEVNESS